MRIKELSERTGVSARLLRYYEEQGLLTPRREENGYRDYDEPLVERVEQIRSLLGAGLTTEIIRAVLPCLAEAADSRYPAPDFVDRIRRERGRMAERHACLTKNLQAMDAYLAAIVKA
ncbi:MerR family transcriptional regulator [Umezawaea sp. NPDC059074]|uniref:MerR family transcriptional regulator n=1 Tax=Umezawaea sp. NPDC059074 TaxID=3346716 RepID=UPI0036C4706D